MPTRQANERNLGRRQNCQGAGRLGVLGVLRIAPGVGQPRTTDVVDDSARRLGRAWPEHFHPDPLGSLQRLTARGEGRKQQVGEWRVVEQQRLEIVAVDRDVAHRLGDDRRQIRGLARQEIDLAEEARCAVPDDLVTRCVDDRGLALANRNEGVPSVTDPEEHVADVSRPLLAVQRERVELSFGQDRSRGARHSTEPSPRRFGARRADQPGSAGPTGLVYYLRCEARELAEGGKA